jgi:hypothetical protein
MVVGVEDKTLSGKVDEQTNQAEMLEASGIPLPVTLNYIPYNEASE